MSRFISFLLVLFLLINIGYSFEIVDSSGEDRKYFSLTEPEVFIVNGTLNSSFFEVNYLIDNVSFVENFSLNNCSDNLYLCGNFSILSLSNYSKLLDLKYFWLDIRLDNSSKRIYFDLNKPSFNLEGYYFQGENLVINYSYYDDSGIKSLLLYQVLNSDYILIENLTNTDYYMYNIDYSGNISFMFKIEDLAGNLNEIIKQIEIKDIFDPVIERTNLIKNNGLYQLEFKISDDSLSSYYIKQGDLVLSSKITGTSLEKLINLPFDSGEIEFIVEDSNSNNVSIFLNLDSPIEINLPNKYTNEKYFSFRSNADLCYLENIDGILKNLNFEKSGDYFRVNLDINLISDYNLEFYCIKDNYKEYFEFDLFYDNQAPSISNLSYILSEDGSIYLNWSESEDNQSEVKYILYRDGDKIYSGTKLHYMDDDVLYPNSYEYYLKVIDEASNFVRSNKVNVIPKKVRVDFSTNIDKDLFVSNSSFKLEVYTEKNVSININVSNNNSIIFNLNNYKSKFSGINVFNLNLSSGLNIVRIKVVDNYSNVKEENFYISYVPEVINKFEMINNSNKVDNLNSINILENNSLKNVINNNSELGLNYSMENSSKLFKISQFWLVIFLLILLIILFAYYLGWKDLKELGGRYLIKKRFNNKMRVNKKNIFSLKISKSIDDNLNKSLENIKKKRILRQKEKELKLRREKMNKKEKVKSEYSLKKIQDISKNKSGFELNNLKFKRDDRNNSSSKILNSIDNSVIFISEKFKKINLNNFKDFKINFNSSLFKRDENINPFDEYLKKVRSSNSWESTREYLERTKIEKERREAEKIRLREEKLRLKEEEKRKKLDEKKKAEEKKLREKLKREKEKEERALARASLDEYLKNKKSKLNYYFAEKLVNLDLIKRKK